MDTSDVGVGEVLPQERKDDIDLPNCYFSLTFDKYQQELSTIEKKMLVLLLSFKHFNVHFIHSWCLLITIPSYLLKQCKIKNTDKLLLLQEYNLIIKHNKCKDDFIANVLSRVR